MADKVAARREMRRQRLLQNPEERLKKILQVKNEKLAPGPDVDACITQETNVIEAQSETTGTENNDAPPVTEHSGSDLEVCSDTSSITIGLPSQTASLSTPMSETDGESQSSDKNVTQMEHLCSHSPETHLPHTLADLSCNNDKVRNIQRESDKDVHFMPVTKEKTKVQVTWKTIERRTLLFILVAVIVRIILELDVSEYLGKSIIIYFALTQLTWHLLQGVDQRALTSLPGRISFIASIVQDLAVYLFVFVLANGALESISSAEESENYS